MRELIILDTASQVPTRTPNGRSPNFALHIDASIGIAGRLQRIEALRAALTTDQLVLHYQPKVDDRPRHALGLRMVAEGVESEEHLQELARLGCDVAQGYHISRPVPAPQLDEWLRAAPAPSSSATHPTW
jgi:sensor c-di-GMP phosphodiesterase-like protein